MLTTTATAIHTVIFILVIYPELLAKNIIVLIISPNTEHMRTYSMIMSALTAAVEPQRLAGTEEKVLFFFPCRESQSVPTCWIGGARSA